MSYPKDRILGCITRSNKNQLEIKYDCSGLTTNSEVFSHIEQLAVGLLVVSEGLMPPAELYIRLVDLEESIDIKAVHIDLDNSLVGRFGNFEKIVFHTEASKFSPPTKPDNIIDNNSSISMTTEFVMQCGGKDPNLFLIELDNKIKKFDYGETSLVHLVLVDPSYEAVSRIFTGNIGELAGDISVKISITFTADPSRNESFVL